MAIAKLKPIEERDPYAAMVLGAFDQQTQQAKQPAQLQVNLAGAWKTVLHFDYGNAIAADQVKQGALMLYEASPATSFRIATQDRHPVVLSAMGKSTYGIWMDAKGAH